MTQPRATEITRHFHHRAATITLDETARHRRRMKMTSDPAEGGEAISFLLDLPQARLLRHGDGLVLDDGRVIEVVAAPEQLFEIRARDPRHLVSLAWQLGNRHLAAQIHEDSIRIRADHVIRTMLEGLGAEVRDVTAPFDPEGGAYAGHGEAHHHGETHLHGENHHHDHDHHHD